ncbi:hypothetical protein K0M31_000268 [Melipona bicolor]|uniref:Uncharacterized protein n=1 Tax=Melipona bicolor TaxID=60889 RepID=A0AA40GD82_9HYME|nr:hypothetical protein K0M31_000268 [Melipona bicolor]
MESTVEKEAKASNIDCDGKRRVGCPVTLTHEDDLALVQPNAPLFPISTRSRPPGGIVTRLHIVAPVSRLWRAGRCHPVVTLHLIFLQQPDSVVVMAETISVM